METEEPKKNWKAKITKRVVLIIIAAILVISGFWWVYIRPVYGRKACNESAIKAATADFHADYPRGQRGAYHTDDYDQYYKMCLRNKGL
jgi:hypothetical protein